MKPILSILLVLVLPALPGPAMDRFEALSQIESHDNDRAVGPQREVSRYQILPEFWAGSWAWDERTNVALRPTDPAAAVIVAKGIMQTRCSAFEARYGRAPDDFEFYILWHRPACYIGRAIPRPITAVEAERGCRFASLCQRREGGERQGQDARVALETEHR
ncbi:MAG: hypothetical protein ABSA45_03755 [Verrucomicrobiota bacterium]